MLSQPQTSHLGLDVRENVTATNRDDATATNTALGLDVRDDEVTAPNTTFG